MPTDYTILQDAAEQLLSILKAAADEIGWEPDSAVAAGEPSYDCDALYVWVGAITPETGDGGCVTTSTVKFHYSIAECVGADRDETLIFTNAGEHHDKVWQIWVAIVDNCCNDQNLLGPYADEVRAGELQLRTNSGGVTVWEGTVSGVMSPVAT